MVARGEVGEGKAGTGGGVGGAVKNIKICILYVNYGLDVPLKLKSPLTAPTNLLSFPREEPQKGALQIPEFRPDERNRAFGSHHHQTLIEAATRSEVLTGG